MTDTGAFQPARQTRLVGGATDRRRGRTQHGLPAPLDTRRQPLETAAGLWCNQPYGIHRRDQPIELRVACSRLQRDHLDAGRGRHRQPGVSRRHNPMAERRQIRNQRGQHGAALARERGWQRLSGKTPAADELMDQDPHAPFYRAMASSPAMREESMTSRSAGLQACITDSNACRGNRCLPSLPP